MPPINLKEYKRSLRREAKAYRASLSADEKAELDAKITQNVLRLYQYKRCSTLFAYVSTDIEIDTRAIIRQAFADGKRVAVPRCTDEQGSMVFHYITSLDDLRTGAFSVEEPDEAAPIARYSDGAFMLVPAFLIDRAGYRIGYGKGYYDRYLTDFAGQTVGLCYNAGFVSRIERGRYDRAVDVVVTENGIKTIAK